MSPNSEFSLKMHVFVEENLGKIILMAGIILLIIGVLELSAWARLESLLGIFWGVALAGIGFLVDVGFSISEFSFTKRLGSFLVVTSVFFFAGACTVILFTEISSVTFIIPMESHTETNPELHPRLPHWETAQPFAWLFIPLFLTGLSCLIFGMILKKRR